MKNLKEKYELNKSNGFTLIELLVVVAIIAILALIVLLAINPVEMARKSRDSRRFSDLGTVRRAIDLALADNQSLSATAGEVTIDTSTDVTDFEGTGLDISKYLSVVPTDPVNDGTADSTQVVTEASGTCSAGSQAKNAFNYTFWSDGDVYVLRAQVESLDNCGAVTGDGVVNDHYEIGTDPGLDMI